MPGLPVELFDIAQFIAHAGQHQLMHIGLDPERNGLIGPFQGTVGAALVNIMFAVSLLGWFGVNIDLFSGAILRLLQDTAGISAQPWIIELVAGAVMTMTTIYGFKAINMLSTVLVPVMMVVTAVLISKALGTRPLGETMAVQQVAEITFGRAVSSVVRG